MNDRLNVQVLRSQLQEAISRIEPLPDEPTFSYVTRVSLLTGTTKRGEVITELFGRSNIRPEQLVHGGFGNFAKHFSSADGVCKDDLSLAHSMLSLFAPFLSSDRLLRAKNRALGSNAIGIIKFVGLRKEQVFRGSPAVCVDCIASDLQKMRFAYHRRVLQVSAVTVCPDHGTPLTTYCEKCGKTLPVSQRYSFRETVALISKLTETAEAYYRRCIEWGAKDLIRSNGRCDHIIELFVHARVSVKHVRALEPYARDLLAELADTRLN